MTFRSLGKTLGLAVLILLGIMFFLFSLGILDSLQQSDETLAEMTSEVIEEVVASEDSPIKVIEGVSVALLPEHRFENHPEELEIGESGWIVPWAIELDEKGGCWLRKEFTLHDSPGGTVNTLILRKEEGFVVNLKDSYFKWSRYRHTKPSPKTHYKVISIIDNPNIKIIK